MKRNPVWLIRGFVAVLFGLVTVMHFYPGLTLWCQYGSLFAFIGILISLNERSTRP